MFGGLEGINLRGNFKMPAIRTLIAWRLTIAGNARRIATRPDARYLPAGKISGVGANRDRSEKLLVSCPDARIGAVQENRGLSGFHRQSPRGLRSISDRHRATRQKLNRITAG